MQVLLRSLDATRTGDCVISGVAKVGRQTASDPPNNEVTVPVDNGYISTSHCVITVLATEGERDAARRRFPRDTRRPLALLRDTSRNGCWTNNVKSSSRELGEPEPLYEEDSLVITKPRTATDGQVLIGWSVHAYNAALPSVTIEEGYDLPAEEEGHGTEDGEDLGSLHASQVGAAGGEGGPDSSLGVQAQYTVADLRKTGVYETDYKELECLGKGNYGSVHRVRSRWTGLFFAAKHVKNKLAVPGVAGEWNRWGAKRPKTASAAIGSTSPFATALEEEIGILRKVRHPNVIRMVDAYNVGEGSEGGREVRTDDAVIIMELCNGGQLLSKMAEKQESRFEEHHARSILQQITRGVAHLHLRGIIHRDLKPENVLLHKYCYTPPGERHEQDRYSVKIADFGMCRIAGWQPVARDVEAEEEERAGAGAGAQAGSEHGIGYPAPPKSGMRHAKSIVGTVRYIAPEVYLKYLRKDAATEVRKHMARGSDTGWEEDEDDGFGFAPNASALDLVMPWLDLSHPVRVWYAAVRARRDALLSELRRARGAASGGPGVKRRRDAAVEAFPVRPFRLAEGEIAEAGRIDARVHDLHTGLSTVQVEDGRVPLDDHERVTIAGLLTIDAMVRGSYDGEAADAYSLGCTAYYSLSGETQYQGGGPGDNARRDASGRTIKDVWTQLQFPGDERGGRPVTAGGGQQSRVRPSMLQQLLLGTCPFPRPTWAGISVESRDLILRLTRVDPLKRLTPGQAQAHPWFKKSTLHAAGQGNPDDAPSPRGVRGTPRAGGQSHSGGEEDLDPDDFEEQEGGGGGR
jgi:serine/threonine protein kinase